MTTQNITLDLYQVAMYKCASVHAKQGDDGSRFLRITLTEHGVAYVIPEGATAYFRCRKLDGHSCCNPAVINDDGTITVELTDQALAVTGLVVADVSLRGADGEILSSVNFSIMVDPAPLGKQIDSASEFLALVDMVERGEALIKKLEQGGGSGGVSSWNDLTDKPFYDETRKGELSFADTSGGAFFDAEALGYRFWKVSGLVPTRDQAMSGVYEYDALAGTAASIRRETPGEEDVVTDTAQVLYFTLTDMAWAVCYATGSQTLGGETVNVPETGVYFGAPAASVPDAGVTVRFSYQDLQQLDSRFVSDLENLIRRVGELETSGLAATVEGENLILSDGGSAVIDGENLIL